MSNTLPNDPLAVLRHIEDACRTCAAGLPHKVETAREWSGIAFRIGSRELVASLGEVVEILEYPQLSFIPGTCSWVRGMANIRGNLMPVIDLAGYLHGALAPLTERTRVLAIEYNDVYTGLVVDEVLGMRHFLNQEFTDEDAVIEDYLRPYTRHGFRRGDDYWTVFSLYALADTPQFLQTAV